MAKSGWQGNTQKLNAKVLNKYKHKAQIAVGIHEDAPDYDDGTSLAMVANILEFGTEKIPEYRWLEKSIVTDKSVYTSMFTKALRRSADSKTQFNLSMEEIGKRAVNAVQQHVEKNDIGLPSNSPVTQAIKGGDSPIMDSRHLVRNIDYKREK